MVSNNYTNCIATCSVRHWDKKEWEKEKRLIFKWPLPTHSVMKQKTFQWLVSEGFFGILKVEKTCVGPNQSGDFIFLLERMNEPQHIRCIIIIKAKKASGSVFWLHVRRMWNSESHICTACFSVTYELLLGLLHIWFLSFLFFSA